MIRKMRWIAWVPTASVALMVLVMYCSWAVAYAKIGRAPRPNLDDPNTIGGFATKFYEICMPFVFVLFIVWLLTWSITCLIADSPNTERGSGWGLGLAVGIIAFGVHVVLFAVSPGDAIQWFVD